MSRKPAPVAEQGFAVPEHHAANKRAAAAAARVAARFAKAPSYNELLESEARAAMRAAEAASRAAQQAQAVAESVLAELQAAKAARPRWQFDEVEEQNDHYESPVVEVAQHSTAGEQEREDPGWNEPAKADRSYEIRWEPDAPMLRTEPELVEARHDTSEWHENTPAVVEEGAIEMVEAAQPIHANLIQFPREIVATRKVRPRRAEGQFAQPEIGTQLSIFEVAPEAISTDPVAADSINASATPTWMSPEWSGLELEEQPPSESPINVHVDLIEEDAPVVLVAHEIDQAPLSLRIMAAVVDGSLVLGALSVFTYEIVSRVSSLPAMRLAEFCAAAALAIAGALYLLFFYALGNQTPGMRYAGIALSTFAGEVPTRRERLWRFALLLLSVFPVGVGVLWSVFDDDHLSWHDRLSKTYLRAY